MNKAILSVEYPEYAAKLQASGYEIIPSESIPCQMPYERRHADLQCLILNDTAFVQSGCQRLANALSKDYQVIFCSDSFGSSYPDNVGLSAVQLGRHIICRVPSLDRAVKDYCAEHGYELIHVNQGYAKCSCTVVSDKALITADNGISRALAGSDIEVLTVEQGRILLDGTDNGFIGGASGYDHVNKTLYFCGDIAAHPQSREIKTFCDKHGTKIVSLNSGELRDIGGIIFC